MGSIMLGKACYQPFLTAAPGGTQNTLTDEEDAILSIEINRRQEKKIGENHISQMKRLKTYPCKNEKFVVHRSTNIYKTTIGTAQTTGPGPGRTASTNM